MTIKELIDTVNQAVNMADVVRTYSGAEIGRNGFCKCPFHGGDRTPSMKVYANSFYCFGCHKGGDAVKFVQYTFDTSALDAVQRINADFALGIDIARPTRADMSKVMEERQRREERARHDAHAWDTLAWAARYLFQHSPKDWDELLADNVLVAILARRDRWEPLLQETELPEWADDEVKYLDEQRNTARNAEREQQGRESQHEASGV